MYYHRHAEEVVQPLSKERLPLSSDVWILPAQMV